MTSKLLLGIIQLALAVWFAWARSDAEKKSKIKELKKEAEDAVKSQDIPRLHRFIELLNRV